MHILTIAWAGTRTEHYRDMTQFVERTLGLEPASDVGDFQLYQLRDGTKIEVFGPHAPHGELLTTGPAVGLLVDDVKLAVAELKNAGMEILSEPVLDHTGNAWAHFRAPDGNVWELTQDPGVARPVVAAAVGHGPARLRMELFVDDPSASARFYADMLGFQPVSEQPDYLSIRRGDVVLGLGPVSKLPLRDDGPGFSQEGLRGRRGAGVEIVLEIDGGAEAIDLTHARCHRLGAVIIEAPQDRPWGLRDFRLSDPDGYYLRITHGNAGRR